MNGLSSELLRTSEALRVLLAARHSLAESDTLHELLDVLLRSAEINLAMMHVAELREPLRPHAHLLRWGEHRQKMRLLVDLDGIRSRHTTVLLLEATAEIRVVGARVLARVLEERCRPAAKSRSRNWDPRRR